MAQAQGRTEKARAGLGRKGQTQKLRADDTDKECFIDRKCAGLIGCGRQGIQTERLEYRDRGGGAV